MSALRLPFAALAAASLACTAPVPEQPAPPVDPEAYAQELAMWKADRREAIAGPDGWATLAGLHWLEGSRFSIGAEVQHDIVLPEGHAPGSLGTLIVADGAIRFEAAPGAAVFRDTTPVDTVTLATDKGGRPTVLQTGSVTFRIIERGGKLAVRVKDSASPVRTGFLGLDYFPADTAARVAAYLDRHDEPRTVRVANIVGQIEEHVSPGVLRFRLGGQIVNLVATQQGRSDGLFVVFRDATSKTETYQAARFLQVPAPDEHGVTVIDFNRAYNPPCAFTAYATCPLPVSENILPIAIRAGEKRYAGAHGFVFVGR